MEWKKVQNCPYLRVIVWVFYEWQGEKLIYKGKKWVRKWFYHINILLIIGALSSLWKIYNIFKRKFQDFYMNKFTTRTPQKTISMSTDFTTMKREKGKGKTCGKWKFINSLIYTPLTILNANNANKVSIYVALIISPQNWYNFRPSRESIEDGTQQNFSFSSSCSL